MGPHHDATPVIKLDPKTNAEYAAFWGDLDDTFQKRITAEALESVAGLGGPNHLIEAWRLCRMSGSYPFGFLVDVQSRRDAIGRVASIQESILDKHFRGDRRCEQGAFEFFGLGLITSERDGRVRVHEMAFSSGHAPIGFHQWHAFAQAAILMEFSPERWLWIDRLVGLSWSIHSYLRLLVRAQELTGPGVECLNEWRAFWLSRSRAELDEQFDRFPVPDLIPRLASLIPAAQ
jgi:hypothetical protein